MENMFFIYILYSKSADKFYIGHTNDPERRLYEHNNSFSKSKFTAKFIPWELKMSMPVNIYRTDAMKIELFIKNQKSRKFILKLIDNKDNSQFISNLINNIIAKD